MRVAWQQRIRRHLAFTLVSGALVGGTFYVLPSTNLPFRLSMASAYASFAFLCASLLIGPWNVLWGCPNPVSTNSRRDIGIWAGLLGLIHMAVGLQVHMGGRFWLYFLYPRGESHFLPVRYDAFGLANFTGLAVALVLMLLLGLSNDFSLRTLGSRRWKALQRWNYVGFVLVAAHGVLYQLLEKRSLPFVGFFAGMMLVVVLMQLAGFRQKKTQGSHM